MGISERGLQWSCISRPRSSRCPCIFPVRWVEPKWDLARLFPTSLRFRVFAKPITVSARRSWVAEDAIEADFELGTICDYNALWYNVIRVPVLPREERLAFVLEWLCKQGLI
jgi:hypothetical protein